MKWRDIKEWIEFNREEAAAWGVFALIGVGVGVPAALHMAGYPFMGFAVMIAGWLSFSVIMNNWGSWFAYRRKPADMEVPSSREDPEAEASLLRAMNRLSPEYHAILENHKIPVEIVHDDAPWINQGIPWAVFTTFGDGRQKITIYSYVMRKHQEREGMTEPEFDDWMYRLLLHEIGHAAGRSDRDMADLSNY